jgi:hypothetical protein
MGRVERQAFVAGPKTAERVQRLNKAVQDCAILPVAGGRGSGKHRFLQWWWQGGCANAVFTGNQGHFALCPDDIVFVSATPSPSSTLPVICVLMSDMEARLEEIKRAREQGEPPKPLGRAQKIRTDAELRSLLNKTILPLIEELDPRAIVVTHAQHLGWRALPWLLELRTPLNLYHEPIAERALILCGTEDVQAKSAGPFRKLMTREQGSEFSLAWRERLEFRPMEPLGEFIDVMLTLIEQNLQAAFGDDVDEDTCLQDFGEWTQVNWRLLVRLVEVLDECLGAQPEQGSRILNAKVKECAYKKWVGRQK